MIDLGKLSAEIEQAAAEAGVPAALLLTWVARGIELAGDHVAEMGRCPAWAQVPGKIFAGAAELQLDRIETQLLS